MMHVLRIRSPQIDAIAGAPDGDFAERLQNHLLEEGFSFDHLGDFRDERGHVLRAMREAYRLGLESEQAVALWVTLTAAHGLSLSGLAERPWFDLLARHPLEGADPDWIERIADEVAGFLDEDAGAVPPDDEP